MNLEERLSHEEVQTRAFQVVSPVSKSLGSMLGGTILFLSDKENRPHYRPQMDTASRNVIIALEGLYNILTRHPVRGLYVVRGVYDWFYDYYRAQADQNSSRRYYVYTEHDLKIPFIPEEDIVYTYMIAQISLIINEVIGRAEKGRIRELTGVFKDANDIAVKVFRKYPTVMPRYHGHNRISLKVIQEVDKPVNCVPSLHIAYSLLLDNIGQMEIAPYPEKKDMMDSIRYSTLRMFNSVLYTKQHSLLCVAGGIALAKKGFEERFHRPFDDLTGTFEQMKTKNPSIDYNTILLMYADIQAMLQSGKSFEDAIGSYLKGNGYRRVSPEADLTACLFDTRKKKIVQVKQ